MGIPKKIRQLNKYTQLKPVLFVLAFAIVGVTVLLLTRAAGPFASVETENASLSGATQVSDTNASGGSYLQFGSGTVTPPPPPSPVPTTFPSASTTGVKGAGISYSQLKASGSFSVTTNGAVIDMLDVTGRIQVYADNVTIKRSRVTHTSAYGIQVMDGSTGLVVENVEIIGSINTTANIGSGKNYTCRKCDLSGSADGAKATGWVTIEDSYIHDMRKWEGTHNDGIQDSGSTDPGPINIRNNTILAPYRTSTSAIIALTNVGYIDGMIIEGNYMSGGSYTVYLNDKGTGYGDPRNSIVRNNVFVKGSTGVFKAACLDKGNGLECATWGNHTSISDAVSVLGNVWDDGTLIPNQ